MNLSCPCLHYIKNFQTRPTHALAPKLVVYYILNTVVVCQDLLEELLHEIELLSSLRHPDLVLHLGNCKAIIGNRHFFVLAPPSALLVTARFIGACLDKDAEGAALA